MKLLRTTLTAVICSLLLSFNTLAAALLAVDRCMEGAGSELHQMADMADMSDMPGTQTHSDCADTEESWITATAQLLCDQGGECHMGGAVVPAAAMASAALPEYAAPVFAKPAFSPTYPTAFWRPPRH